MKKIICIMLAFSMCLSLGINVFAEDTEGLENAILTVKSKIIIPDECTEFSSNISKSNDGIEMYSMSWESKYVEDSDTKSINVTINSDNNITRYSYDNNQNSLSNKCPMLPKFTDEELTAKAYEWFVNINPDLSSEYTIENSTCNMYNIYSGSSIVVLCRYINNIPFCGDSARIFINNQTGEIIQLYNDLTYCNNIPNTDNLISVYDAEKTYRELSPINAEYRTASENEAVIVYVPEKPYLNIDAKYNGEFSKEEYEAAQAESTGASGGSSSDNGFTEQELKAITNIQNLLSVDELCQMVQNIPELGLNNLNFEFQTCRYINTSKNDTEEQKYDARLTYQTNDSDYRSAYITIDAQSGELKSYYNTIYYDSTLTPKITKQQGLETTKTFLSTYAPEEFPETLQDDKSYFYRNEYQFYFSRVKNNIFYRDNSLNITIDNQTGLVSQYSKYWNNNVEFESNDNMISSDEAQNLLLDKVGINLRYMRYETDNNLSSVALVYSLNKNIPHFISGTSGDVVEYNGSEYNFNMAQTADDISGHYAEKEISSLLMYNVLSLPADNLKFRPNDKITQKEMIAFASALKGRTFPMPLQTESVYRYGRRYGILNSASDVPDPDAVCSQEQGLKYIIDAIGYSEVASISSIYNSLYQNKNWVSAGFEGYVALANGLHIIDTKRINPKGDLSRADAAVMIYNYLSR